MQRGQRRSKKPAATRTPGRPVKRKQPEITVSSRRKVKKPDDGSGNKSGRTKTKAVTESDKPVVKILSELELKSLIESSDVTGDLPNPPNVNRITEVDMSLAPTGTKKDHDYRPVLFAGASDIDAINEQYKDMDDVYSTLRLPLDQLTCHVIVPEAAKWFNYNEIHQIERRAVPEFFNETNPAKTPTVYKSCRNFIIDTYRSDPYHYLSITSCRSRLVGDICSVYRVHAFLEMWGLINLNLNITNRPGHTTSLGLLSDGHYMVISETKDGLVPSDPVRTVHKPLDKQILDEDELPTFDFAGEDVKLDLETLGIEHKRTEVEKNPNSNQYTREWTDFELLKLMEGVETYKDDWNKISELVGTRTLDECLLCFLALPIQDRFSGQSDSDEMREDLLPFATTPNPMMATLAFLATVVDPRVAASASKAANDELSQYMVDGTNTDQIVEKHVQKIKEAIQAEKAQKSGSPKSPSASTSSFGAFPVDDPMAINDMGAIKSACDKALAAGAKKAEQIAKRVEYRLKSHAVKLLNKTMNRLEIKMAYLEQIEQQLDKEIEMLTEKRLLIQSDRENYHQEVLENYKLQAKTTPGLPTRSTIYHPPGGIEPESLETKPSETLEDSTMEEPNEVSETANDENTENDKSEQNFDIERKSALTTPTPDVKDTGATPTLDSVQSTLDSAQPTLDSVQSSTISAPNSDSRPNSTLPLPTPDDTDTQHSTFSLQSIDKSLDLNSHKIHEEESKGSSITPNIVSGSPSYTEAVTEDFEDAATVQAIAALQAINGPESVSAVSHIPSMIVGEGGMEPEEYTGADLNMEDTDAIIRAPADMDSEEAQAVANLDFL